MTDHVEHVSAERDHRPLGWPMVIQVVLKRPRLYMSRTSWAAVVGFLQGFDAAQPTSLLMALGDDLGHRWRWDAAVEREALGGTVEAGSSTTLDEDALLVGCLREHLIRVWTERTGQSPAEGLWVVNGRTEDGS